MQEKLHVSFIGTGNMAGAIIRGLAKTQKDKVEMGLFDLNMDKSTALAEETGSMVAENLEAAVLYADVIVLAVKPQNMADLLQEIAPYCQLAERRQIVISVAAGVEIKVYEQYLPGVAVARAMPNTSCAVLAAISGLMAGKHMEAADKAVAEQLFNAIGSTIWIDEKDIHALIAVSGSGPAYFYYFTEQMAKVGEKLGLQADIAEKLARHTAIGVGKMLEEKTESAETLRIQITSPNGTTEKAIESFSRSLPRAVEDAMRACAERSEEMAK